MLDEEKRSKEMAAQAHALAIFAQTQKNPKKQKEHKKTLSFWLILI